MMVDWRRSDGEGRACYLSQEFGIPGLFPAWRRSFPFLILGDEIIFFENLIYYRDNKGTLYAADLESGKDVWQAQSPQHSTIFFEADEEQILVASAVFSKEHQKLLYDFRLGNIPYTRRAFETLVSGGALREVDRDSRPGECLYYEADKNKTEIVNLNIMDIMSYDNGRSLLGVRGEHVVSFDWKNKRDRWIVRPFGNISLLNIKQSVYVTKSYVYVMNLDGNTVVKIGRDDGNIIALFDLNGVDIKLDEHRIQQCIFSDDTFHIRTIGLFLSFDSSSGSCTWKKELDSSLKFCGAGDIIFGLLNNKTVVGWDRYTGDELWYISQEDLNLLYIKPSRRHVIVGSEEGVMLCYKWSTPYQSA